MKNFPLPAFLPLAVAVAAGCRAVPEPVCQSRLLVPVVQATGPRQAAVNQKITYTLTVRLGNSCGAFDTIVVNQGDNLTGPIIQQVGVQGKYTGCSCTADTTTLTPVAYQFQPTRAGTYYVQFLTRQSAFFTDTLTVQ